MLVIGLLFNIPNLLYITYIILPSIIIFGSYRILKGYILDIRFLFLLFLAIYTTLPAIFCLAFSDHVFLRRFSERLFHANAVELNYSFILHILCMLFLFIGSFLNHLKGNDNIQFISINSKYAISSNAVKYFNFIFLFIILYILFFVFNIRDMIGWNYLEFHKFSSGKGVFLFWLSTFPFFIGLNIYTNQSKKLLNIWTIVFLVVILFVALLTGKRSYAFPSAIGMLFYITYYKRTNILYTLLIIIVLYFSLQIYGIARAFKGRENFTVQLQEGWNFFKEHQEMMISDEFSTSVINTTGTIKLLKSENWQLSWGSTFLEFFRGIVPSTIDINRGELIDQRFARLVDRKKFQEGAGYGFSIVGDSYLNYGIIGIPVIFLLFGFMLNKFEHWDSNYKDILRFSMLPVIIFFPRTSLSGSLKSLVLYSLIPFIFFILFYNFLWKYVIVKKAVR